MKIIVVNCFKGGVGKTTISTTLALSLAKKGRKVVIVDGDTSTSSVESNLHKNITTVKERKSRMHSKASISKLIEKAKDMSPEYIIVDTPPTLNTIILGLLDILSPMNALVVTTAEEKAIKDSLRGIKLMRKKDVNFLGVIVNMSGPEFGTSKGVEEKLGIEILTEVKLKKKVSDRLPTFTKKLLDKIELKLIPSVVYDLNETTFTFMDLSVEQLLSSSELKKKLRFFNLETWETVQDIYIKEVNGTIKDWAYSERLFDTKKEDIEKLLKAGKYIDCMVNSTLAVVGAPPIFAIETMEIVWGQKQAMYLPMLRTRSGTLLHSIEVSLNADIILDAADDYFFLPIDEGAWIPFPNIYVELLQEFVKENEWEYEFQKYMKYSNQPFLNFKQIQKEVS